MVPHVACCGPDRASDSNPGGGGCCSDGPAEEPCCTPESLGAQIWQRIKSELDRAGLAFVYSGQAPAVATRTNPPMSSGISAGTTLPTVSPVSGARAVTPSSPVTDLVPPPVSPGSSGGSERCGRIAVIFSQPSSLQPALPCCSPAFKLTHTHLLMNLSEIH